MVYSCTATFEYKGVSGQIPSFILDGRIQGIRSVKHAEFIAEEVCNPCRIKGMKIHVTVIEADREVWAS